MATLLDQRPQQESGDDISRNYMPSQQPRMRALEQRAAYDAAKLQQDAEAAARQARMDATKAQNDDIRLGLDLSRERRAQNAEALDLKKSAAEMALKERDDMREQRALDEAPAMLAELEASRGKAGYIPAATETAIRLKYPFAAFSKNARIAKVWDDERSLRENLSATEAANFQNIEKEKRAEAKWIEDQNKLVLENQAAGELAEKLKLKATGIGGDGRIRFGEGDQAGQGTRRVVTDPTGMKTVTETRPITDAAPVTPAPATAATARPIFKDAKGRRAYKNPDGTFEEIP